MGHGSLASFGLMFPWHSHSFRDGPRPRQRPPRDCSLLRVPTGRLSRVKLLLLDMSLGTRAQQSEEGVRRAGPVLGPRVFGGHT